MRLTAATRWNLLLAILAAVALIVLATRGGEDRGIEIEARDPAPGIDELRVDVAGAVVRPGVIIVAPGERVADALARAGGPTAEADTAAVNLARRLVDEDHIVVPRRGERSALLDLNAATARQLEALPGIGPVLAAAVLASRSRAAFTSTDELVERGLISPRVYEAIRNLVAVR